MKLTQQLLVLVRTTMAYNSVSLYVTDLQGSTSEADLYEKFNAVANVASIRVCRDSRTRQSLKYAYINFHSVRDGKPCLLFL